MEATIRYWSKLLSGLFFGIGFLAAAFTERHQALHDKMASTLVVRSGRFKVMTPPS